MKIMNLPFLRHKLQWLALLAAMLTVSSTASAFKVYLRPSGEWKQNNERYAVYYFGNGDGWVDMSQIGNTGFYLATVPEKNYTHVIFCRMNGSTSENIWNNKWCQSGDIAVSDAMANVYAGGNCNSGISASGTVGTITGSSDIAVNTDGSYSVTSGGSSYIWTSTNTTNVSVKSGGSSASATLTGGSGVGGSADIYVTYTKSSKYYVSYKTITVVAACTPPSALTATFYNVSNCTTAQIQNSALASGNNRMVVLYSGRNPSITAPTNGTSYTSGTSALGGTIKEFGGTGDIATITGLTDGALYTAVVYQYVPSTYCYSDGTPVLISTAPIVTTADAGSITTSGATLGGNIVTNKYGAVTDYGIEWVSGTSGSVQVGTDNKSGEYSYNATGLTQNTAYTYKAYAKNASCAKGYGEVKEFTTQAVVTRIYANVSGPNWGSPYFYYWNSSKQALGSSWRGDAMTSDGNGWWHFDIPAAKVAAATGGGFIINGSDSDQTGNLSLPAGFSAGDTYCITVASNKSVTPFPAAPTAALQNGVSENTVCAGTAPVFRVTAPLTAGFKYQLFLSNGTAASSEYTAAEADVLAGHIDVTASSGIAAGNSSTYYVLVTANSPNSCKTASSSDITVSGTAPALITASAPAFSNKLVGSSETQTFSVTKACNPEGITQVKFSDNSSTTYNGFTISNWNNSSNPITFDVTYSYPVAGTRTATLLIEYAAGGSWTQEISATATTPTRIYFKITSSAEDANAWFALYCYKGSNNTWYRMQSYDKANKVYYADVVDIDQWTNFIFVRRNPDYPLNDGTWNWNWNTECWSQTADLNNRSTNNLYTTSGWNDNTMTGSWGTYTPTGNEIPSMYVKGPLIDGTNWSDPYDKDGWTSVSKVNGVFTYVKEFNAKTTPSGDESTKFSACLSTTEADDTKLGRFSIPSGNRTNVDEAGGTSGNDNFKPHSTVTSDEHATLTITRNGYSMSGSDYTITYASCATVPAITLSAASNTICANTAPALSSSSTSNVSYQLYTSDDEPVGDPVPGTGSSISFDADAITTATTYYVIGTSTVSGCESQTNTSNNLAISTTPDYTISGATSATAWKPITITTSPEQATATWSITTNPDSKGYLSTETGASTVFKGAAPGSAGTTNYIIKASVTSNNCTLERYHTVGVVYTDCE